MKKMKTLSVLLSLALWCISVESFSQKRTIHGKITAFNKYPIADIEVHAGKSKAKATTDESGRFSIEVKKRDYIRIDDPVFHDYEKRIKSGDNELEINLIYEDSEVNKEKAVEKGYFTEKELNYGLRYLNRDNNLYALFSDVYEAIDQAIPEAERINNSNGTVGYVLRGVRSIQGNNQAIYLVNGRMTDDISFIVPADIKSIRKLSNAQSSMYGSRGGNGVISIELYE